MVDVGGVPAVPEHHTPWVHALFVAQHPLHLQRGVRAGVRVHGDRGAGALVRPGHCAHHPIHPRGQPLGVDGALEQGGLHTGTGDAVLDIPDEHVDHRVGDFGAGDRVERRTPVVEEERHVVVGVAAGGHDDVQIRKLLRDALDAWDVAAESDHGRVDDGAHSLRCKCAELLDRIGDPRLLVAPLVGVVLLDVGTEHEDVLVQVGAPQGAGLDGPSDGLDGGAHPRSSFLRIFPVGPFGSSSTNRNSRGYL